ncbi:MAG: J domain-containing protein, partial [Bryobacteraceae bacterium]
PFSSEIIDVPVNYYDLLQIHPRAEMETVQRVYKLFAARYHPDNLQTGDAERFRQIREAFEILSNAESRASYDQNLEFNQPTALPVFQSKEFTDGIDAEAKLRIGVLCLLYAKRRANSDLSALSMLDLENLMAFPREHLQFSIWYLKGRRFITQDDRSSFVITPEGVDFLETQLPQNEILYKIFKASESGVMVFPKGLLNGKNR